MDKLQSIEEMERSKLALKAEVAQEAKQKQWEPEGGEFLCHHTGFIVDLNEDDFASKINGCAYKTEMQAEKAAAAMRTHNRLLAYVAEFAPDWEPDWSDRRMIKCHVFFDYTRNEWAYDLAYSGIYACAVYMPQNVAIELCRKLNSGEVVL